jgi:hypothetical protein
MTFPKTFLFLGTLAMVAFAARTAQTLEEAPQREYFKRLRSPATAIGVIGGESHDSYVIHARKGQIMSVQISWRPEPLDDATPDTIAQFSVSGLPVFSDDGDLKGKESHNGSHWTSRIPRDGNYYIYVVGYPTVRYTLKVTVQ